MITLITFDCFIFKNSLDSPNDGEADEIANEVMQFTSRVASDYLLRTDDKQLPMFIDVENDAEYLYFKDWNLKFD